MQVNLISFHTFSNDLLDERFVSILLGNYYLACLKLKINEKKMNNKKEKCQCKNYKNCLCRKRYSSVSLSHSSEQQSQTSGYDASSKVTSQVSGNRFASRTFPSTLNLEPNIYYYTKNGLVGSEESNIYYKISNIDNKISNYINSKLKYTPERDYFERVEKLRFRLPTAEQYSIKTRVPIEELDARVENVRRFRENNLDDCVNEEEQEFRNSHRCVHRYRLNQRGFPEPVFRDEDGNSLCSVPSCYTPSKYLMENNITPMNCEKRFMIPQGSGDEFLDKVEGFGPVLLLEATNVEEKSKIERNVKRNGRQKFNPRDTFPVPDSLALKYQRREW